MAGDKEAELRVLVTGPESSGTKLTASQLIRAGAEVVHDTPRKCIDDPFRDGSDFDAVVLVVRNGYANARSIVDNGHAYDGSKRDDLSLAYRMIPEALQAILDALVSFENVYVVTYESLVWEPGAIRALLRDLGLDENADLHEVGNGNAKYWHRPGPYFRDTRALEER